MLRLWRSNSACKGCECAVARDIGEQSAEPVEQFTSAPQKIRLKVSCKSLHCTFMHRACRHTEGERERAKLG